MPRFVILEHDHPVLHWDLMLEAGDVLQTWRLAQPPESSSPIEATQLPDHRLLYLDYEGPVSGDRGRVSRWDAGRYVEDANSPAGTRILIMAGMKIRGKVRLERVEGTTWRFTWLSEPET